MLMPNKALLKFFQSWTRPRSRCPHSIPKAAAMSSWLRCGPRWPVPRHRRNNPFLRSTSWMTTAPARSCCCTSRAPDLFLAYTYEHGECRAFRTPERHVLQIGTGYPALAVGTPRCALGETSAALGVSKTLIVSDLLYKSSRDIVGHEAFRLTLYRHRRQIT